MNQSLYRLNRTTLIISTILITLTTPTIQAEGLGRLFTSPEQRAMLEKLRQPVKTYDPIIIVDHSNQPIKKESVPETITKTEVVIPTDSRIKSQLKSEVIMVSEPHEEYELITEPAIIETKIPAITVNGFVKRAHGQNTAWVNGMNTNDGYFEPQHIKVNPNRIDDNLVHIEVDDINIGEVSLKVGQTLDPNEAKITDSYEEIVGDSNQ